MSDWIHNLPVPLMALAIFAFTYLLAIIIFATVSTLATGERAKSFQAISPGMLPVLGSLQLGSAVLDDPLSNMIRQISRTR